MVQKLEKILGLEFAQKKLLDSVFVHRSYVNENKNLKLDHNERLEFLGDAVLELIITRYLYDAYPDAQEGVLTNLRSALVRKDNLAKLAKKLELGKYLRLSKGEEKSGGREKDYILANTYEALIGSIYLDQGLETSRKFVLENVIPSLETIMKENLHIDHKSAFQEYTQEKLRITPLYETITAEGPDHDKVFTMGVYLDGKLIAKGSGASKRKGEEDAAHKALLKLKKKEG